MSKRIISVALAVVSLCILSGINTSATTTEVPFMNHEWTFDVGDTIYYNGDYYIVWKRAEALHPDNLRTYYYYQIALEGSMKGLWIWEGNLSSLENSYSSDGGIPDPPPPPKQEPCDPPDLLPPC